MPKVTDAEVTPLGLEMLQSRISEEDDNQLEDLRVQEVL